jgi:hypothetical protein
MFGPGDDSQFEDSQFEDSQFDSNLRSDATRLGDDEALCVTAISSRMTYESR